MSELVVLVVALVVVGVVAVVLVIRPGTSLDLTARGYQLRVRRGAKRRPRP